MALTQCLPAVVKTASKTMNGGLVKAWILSLENKVLASSRKAQIFTDIFILTNIPINYNRRTVKLASAMKDGGIINRFSRCAWDWALHQVLHEVLAFIVMVTFDLLSNGFEIFHCMFVQSCIFAALLLTRSFFKSLSVGILKVNGSPIP